MLIFFYDTINQIIITNRCRTFNGVNMLLVARLVIRGGQNICDKKSAAKYTKTKYPLGRMLLPLSDNTKAFSQNVNKRYYKMNALFSLFKTQNFFQLAVKMFLHCEVNMF